LKQYGAFSASVEVGLQEYTGPDGPRKLMGSLLDRYCPKEETVEQTKTTMSANDAKKLDREIDEARRQIALLFGLLEKSQPVEDITAVLAQIDNATIYEVEVIDGGAGYAPGYGPPNVEFPSPEAGKGYDQAKGRAVLKPNGRILRIDAVDRGFGYAKPPDVSVSPPAVAATKKNTTEVYAATAKSILFPNGINKGRIERIELLDSGEGYSDNEKITVKISPPQLPLEEGGVPATAQAIREFEVGKIIIVVNGNGYAAEKAIQVKVEPPPVFARVNMNDPILRGSANEASKRKLPNRIPTVLGAINSSVAKAAEDGSAGCTGRGCYDRQVVAYGYARADTNVYASRLDKDVADRIQKKEAAVEGIGPQSFKTSIRGFSADGSVGGRVSSSSWGGGSSASLLALLPNGIGLQYDSELGRYKLAARDGAELDLVSEDYPKPLNPEFGPRGRSPIEKQKDLDLGTFRSFAMSGALSCAATHFTLTPLDVVKTKIQTDPENYPNAVVAFQKLFKGGLKGLFSGWVPTTLGFFTIGGFSYSTTELFRRWCEDFAGPSASQLEVPIILFSAAVSAFFGAFIIAPFETVRIRSVYQPDYAENALGVVKRMNEEEGPSSFFSAVPAFALKDVPYCMAKFTVFDLSSSYLYNMYPVAREDLRLSLYVSLVAGTLGGITAAIVSNPADASISEMKKSKSDISPPQAAMAIIDRGGPALLFSGLPVRMLYYSILVSLQFLLYDTVRFALGIGSDDLKLYLDVLGGALSETGGPV
jgi:solute carrier family 25 phosphate transporter 3